MGIAIIISVLFMLVVFLTLLLIHFIKEDDKKEEQIKKLKNEVSYKESVINNYTKGIKENEELVHKMHSDVGVGSLDSAVELMQKSAEKGQSRNNRY